MTDAAVINLTTTLANALARVIAGRPMAESQAEWEDVALRLQRDLFDRGVQVRSCGTGNQKRLGPWGPLHPTDFAVTVVIGRHVGIVSSKGAPPSVMPDEMVRDLVTDMALQALRDIKRLGA